MDAVFRIVVDRHFDREIDDDMTVCLADTLHFRHKLCRVQRMIKAIGEHQIKFPLTETQVMGVSFHRVRRKGHPIDANCLDT